jgi:hypothetical protein
MLIEPLIIIERVWKAAHAHYKWIAKFIKILACCEFMHVLFFTIKPSILVEFHLLSLILPAASLFVYYFCY